MSDALPLSGTSANSAGRAWYSRGMQGYQTQWAVVVAAVLVSAACGGGGDDTGGQDASGGRSGSGGSGPTTPVEPVALDPAAYTYSLSEGTEQLPLWTTPVTRKLSEADREPGGTRRSGLALSAARNEFEPVQLVIGPAEGRATVTFSGFADLGGNARAELAVAGFDSGRSEQLAPIASGDSVELTTSAGTPVWLTVYVPPDAPAGDHEGTLTVARAGDASVDVPVALHVYDFALPEEIHFATQLNISVGDLVPADGTVDDAKTLLFEHRMTPKSVTWPSGFAWNITWDNAASPDRCSTLYDEPDESEQYSIRYLADRYIHGTGWNGVGFPNAMLFQFVDNSTPRPDTFCGISRSSAEGSAAYNAEWSEWLAALDEYLVSHAYEQKAYYYVQNEPQEAADDALAAHLCTLTRAAAPHLRLAISEEPKPEIAETCGYDIWIAHVRAYEEDYAWERQRDAGEQVWFYSLDQDPDPYFNPTDVARPGLHERIIPWAAWSHRIRGWAYYDANRFFDGPNPTVRAELLREGFEDYEYLWLANGEQHPRVDADLAIDDTVHSVAASMTSWTKDADALMKLRDELGRYLEGDRDSLPRLEIESSRPVDSYYLNFQDPHGEPTADPLIVDGKTYLKIGWDAYDDAVGYGWSGEHIDNPDIAKYGFDEVDGYDVRQQSYVFDDYGRDNLFEFDLAPGTYEITVGVGRPARAYGDDPHHVTIEGMKLIDDEPTTDPDPTIVRSTTLEVTDGRLSVIVGGRSATTGNYAYTFLAFIDIDPAE